jgi:CRISPR/Cas system-associated exonuclease Cas4 (RecB family)
VTNFYLPLIKTCFFGRLNQINLKRRRMLTVFCPQKREIYLRNGLKGTKAAKIEIDGGGPLPV